MKKERYEFKLLNGCFRSKFCYNMKEEEYFYGHIRFIRQKDLHKFWWVVIVEESRASRLGWDSSDDDNYLWGTFYFLLLAKYCLIIISVCSLTSSNNYQKQKRREHKMLDLSQEKTSLSPREGNPPPNFSFWSFNWQVPNPIPLTSRSSMKKTQFLFLVSFNWCLLYYTLTSSFALLLTTDGTLCRNPRSP